MKTLEILDQFDGPELIHARDEFDSRHLVYFSKVDDEGGEIYHSTLITEGRLGSLRNGEISVREVFENPEAKLFYEVRIKGDETVITMSDAGFMEMPEGLLPPEDYFLRPPSASASHSVTKSAELEWTISKTRMIQTFPPFQCEPEAEENQPEIEGAPEIVLAA